MRPHWAVGPLVLEVPGHLRPVPVLQAIGIGIACQFPDEILVTGRVPGVIVLVVVAFEVQLSGVGLGILFDVDLLSSQCLPQAAAVEDIGQAREARRAMELQGDLAGEVEPERHFLLLSRRGKGGRQACQVAAPNELLEELGLRDAAHDLHVIDVPFPEHLAHQGFVFLKGIPGGHGDPLGKECNRLPWARRYFVRRSQVRSIS
jgi:hypothetical protein